MPENDDLTVDEKTERDELREKKEKLKLVKNFVEHPCWDGIIWPMLKKEKEAALTSLLMEENPTYEVMINLRADIKAIDNLIGKINFIITEGIDATEQLKGKPL